MSSSPDAVKRNLQSSQWACHHQARDARCDACCSRQCLQEGLEFAYKAAWIHHVLEFGAPFIWWYWVSSVAYNRLALAIYDYEVISLWFSQLHFTKCCFAFFSCVLFSKQLIFFFVPETPEMFKLEDCCRVVKTSILNLPHTLLLLILIRWSQRRMNARTNQNIIDIKWMLHHPRLLVLRLKPCQNHLLLHLQYLLQDLIIHWRPLPDHLALHLPSLHHISIPRESTVWSLQGVQFLLSWLQLLLCTVELRRWALSGHGPQG